MLFWNKERSVRRRIVVFRFKENGRKTPSDVPSRGVLLGCPKIEIDQTNGSR